jgi:hypothetical protein
MTAGHWKYFRAGVINTVSFCVLFFIADALGFLKFWSGWTSWVFILLLSFLLFSLGNYLDERFAKRRDAQ